MDSFFYCNYVLYFCEKINFLKFFSLFFDNLLGDDEMKILTQLFFMSLIILICTLMILSPAEKRLKLSSDISTIQTISYNLSVDTNPKQYLIASKFTY